MHVWEEGWKCVCENMDAVHARERLSSSQTCCNYEKSRPLSLQTLTQMLPRSANMLRIPTAHRTLRNTPPRNIARFLFDIPFGLRGAHPS